jgi:release factor glutamine methyltransferase
MLWRGLKFNVNNPEVYPPKPATLLLAEAALRVVKPRDSFLEIGTGAGAVAIAVAKFVRGATVTASDINGEATKIASLNAKLNRVKVKTVVGD